MRHNEDLLLEWNIECEKMNIPAQYIPKYEQWLEKKLLEARNTTVSILNNELVGIKSAIDKTIDNSMYSNDELMEIVECAIDRITKNELNLRKTAIIEDMKNCDEFDKSVARILIVNNLK